MGEPREVPPLHECPGCGLPIEAGSGPRDLAWHDCDWVAAIRASTADAKLTVDEATERILTIAVARAHTLSGRELSELLEGIARVRDSEQRQTKEASHGVPVSGSLADWLKDPGL